MARMTDSDKNIHKGHRERMRKKYFDAGFKAFSDHEVLEFLLYYCNAQQNTNEIAHALISQFGSLGAVFAAPIGELVKVKGIGTQSAYLIKFVSDLMGTKMSDFDSRESFNTSDSLGDYMMPFYKGLTVETTFVMALDSNRKLIRVIKIADGSFDAVAICVPKITRELIGCGASAAAIFHNHPFGAALPSVTDLKTTKKVQSAFESVGIEFIDHIIVSNRDNDYVSLRDSGERLYTVASPLDK